MKTHTAASIFECLSSAIRLDVFRLLVRHAPHGLVAGEISTTLGIPPTNMSFHLKTLAHAGLVTVEQEGRFLRYRANTALMFSVIGYLSEQCCGGQPEQCGLASCNPEQTPRRRKVAT